MRTVSTRSATSFSCPECGFQDQHPVRLPGGRVCCRACQFVPGKPSIAQLTAEFMDQLKRRGTSTSVVKLACTMIPTIAVLTVAPILLIKWLNMPRAPSGLEDRAQWIVNAFLHKSCKQLAIVTPPGSEAVLDQWEQRRSQRWDAMIEDSDPKIYVQVMSKDANKAQVLALVEFRGDTEKFKLDLPFTRQDDRHEWLFDCGKLLASAPKHY